MQNFTLQSLFAPKKRLLLLVFLCFITFTFSNAQNYITNGDFESGNKVGYDINGLGYTFVTGLTGSSNPGDYALIADPFSMNNATFIHGKDHSGVGKMLAIHGNTSGGQQRFYKAGTNGGGVCGLTVGALYTFTYYVGSISSTVVGAATQADIGVSFNNATSVTLIAGTTLVPLPIALPASNWQKVTYTFIASNACVNIEMYNNNTSAAGNDFAIDDISLYGPPKPITLSYTQSNLSCPTSNDGTIIGYAGWGVPPYTFTLTGPTVVPSNSTGIFTGLAAGNYSLKVDDSQATPDNKTVSPIVLTAPLDISVTSDAVGCVVPGTLVKLTASNAGPTYTWKNSLGTVLGTANPYFVNPIVNTTYTVESTISTTTPPSNLITNGDFEIGNTGFKSSYGFYSGSTAGANKAYGIQSDPKNSFMNFVSCGDKTTGTGLMMVVDGAIDGTSVVWSQTVHVEPSTNYDFSFWVQNLTALNPAKFKVTIGGTAVSLSALSATNIPTGISPSPPVGCGWTQIKGTWPSGLVTPNPEIIIIDTETNPSGNDFGLDNITFIPQTSTVRSCPLSKTISINVGGNIDQPFTYATPVCKNGANPTPTPGTGFISGGTYSASSTNLIINSTTGVIDLLTSLPGSYTVTYAVTSGCNSGTTVTPVPITINAQPIAGTSGSTTICETSSTPIDLFSLITGEQTGGTWTRTTGAGGVFNAASGTFTPAVGATTSTFTYTLTGTSPCVNSTSVSTVIINPQPIAGTSGNTTVCESSSTPINLSSLITGEQSGGTWTRTTGTGGIFTAASGTYTPAVGATTSTFTYALAGTSPCINSSSVATVTIIPQPIAGTSGNTTVCDSDTTSIDLYSLITGEQAGGSWSRTTGSGGTFNSATGSFTPAIGATNSTFTYNLVGTAPCVNSTSIATVNVNPIPTITIGCGIPTANSVQFNWNAISGATSYTYSYSVASGVPVTGNTAGNTFTVNGLLPGQNVSISVTSVGNTCIATGIGNCVSSSCPTPTVTPLSDITVCANGTVSVPVFASTPAGATFNWASNNTAIGIVANGTGDISSFTGLNTTAITQTATITVTATNATCTGPASTFKINVIPLPVVALTSSISSSLQTVCINTPLSAITYSIGGTGTGATVSALPAGVTGSFSAGVFTISGTPSVSGSFPYTISTSGGCSPVATLAGTITVSPLPTITLTSLVTTTTQTLCVNTALTNIAYAVSGSATSATVTGLPVGVTGSFTAGVLTISGTPTVSGSFGYTVSTSGGCSPAATLTGTITVSVLPTITLTSGTSSTTQSVCINTALTNISYLVGGTGTGASVSVLPAGLSGSFSAGVFTISGTPTVSGSFPYIVNTTGGCSPPANLSGIINISPISAISLVSTTATTTQTICINTNISQISYSLGGSATGAIVTGLPTGVTGAFTLGIFTLSGSPTVAGTFNYIVTTTGGCTPAVSLNGTITVSPISTLILTSVASTTNQVFCLNSALNAITYAVGGSATGAVVNGLPAGVTGNFAGGVVTISGTPTISGVYNYTVTTTGGCSPTVILRGTITINPIPTMILSSAPTTTNQTICLNDSIIPITYTVGGSANGATVTGLPAGVTGTFVTGIFTISGTPTLQGNFNYRVTTTGICTPAIVILGTITVNSLPIASYTGITSLCSGNVTSIVLSSTIPGSTFSWNAVQNNVSGASSSTGNTIAQTLSTTGTNVGQVVYNVTPIAGSCLGLPKKITIDVSPVPNVVDNTAKKIVCSGETTNIALSSGIVGTTFSWTVNASGVTGATAGSGNTITQTLSNLGFVPGTVDYTITPSINGCIGTPIVVTITVNPLPEVLGTPPGTICSGYNTNVVLSPTISGTTFDWTVLQVGVTGAIAGTGNTINQILEATGNSQGNVTYTITPSLNGCIGIPLDIIVNVNPSPKPSLVGGVICVEQATGIAFRTNTLDSGLSASNYNFVWYLNTLPIIGANSNTYDAIQSGDYKVQATNNVTGCDATSDTVKVTDSFPGLAMTTTQTLAFSDNAMVTVSVTGGNAAFEYQLDNGSFQSSNVFDNLKPGQHTITVGDENGCTNLTQNIFVIGYPKFFSPNGDGHNDFWNVVGLDGQPASVIYIFDRYGKLLKQINPTSDGWDGFYIGAEMPATDYWFTIEYTEQSQIKLFKSHFSLIR
ncbi:T9SS type B sorting domain-containing protein [Flavobacterium sp. IMCC34518]|uniref:T9SS type B sorting domain-containing protein n=1 Tax=Flavobacterium sp. IMCC34518 TaxID=3003623 RepID=UPI0022AC2DCE|nr:T9SS type B sorting domain-containing protein [Flavobacterium sp. IMCC34518]